MPLSLAIARAFLSDTFIGFAEPKLILPPVNCSRSETNHRGHVGVR
jgi:hypothetical protein